MAKVIGPIKLRGTVGDMNFRLTEHGNIAGEKPGPTRERVLTDEKFELTRRQAREFQGAIRDATLLRRALGSALNGRKGSSLNGRMNGVMSAVVEGDMVSDYGYRCVALGDLNKLKGFEFNKELSLDSTLGMQAVGSLDVAGGRGRVELPVFIARKRAGIPKEATYFKIVMGLVALNFEEGTYQQCIRYGELLPLRKKTPVAMVLEGEVKAVAGNVLIQVVGMNFYKMENGVALQLKGSAMQVVGGEEGEVRNGCA